MLGIVIIQGAIGIIGLAAFLVGFFQDISLLMIVGGTSLVIDDILSILSRALNPIVPVILTVSLAIVFEPWYEGVFWASASFAAWDYKVNWWKLTAPKTFIEALPRSYVAWTRLDDETPP